MVAFSAVFFVAFVYMVARGALEWGPLKKQVPVADVESAVAEGGVARPGVKVVGLDGRGAPVAGAA